MKALDQVLGTLLDMDDQRGDFFNLKSSLEYAHPDLSEDELSDILDRLKKMKLISTPAHKMKGSPRFVKVNPSAYIYYQNREERDAAEVAAREAAKEKALEEIEEWEDRSWSYRTLLIGYIAGIISGISLMWVKAAFFP